jgi:hypothetical protein
MRRKGVYLIGKAVDGLRRRSRYAIWGERDDFSSPGFAVGFGSEGRKLDMTRVQVEGETLGNWGYRSVTEWQALTWATYVMKATSWTLILSPLSSLLVVGGHTVLATV